MLGMRMKAERSKTMESGAQRPAGDDNKGGIRTRPSPGEFDARGVLKPERYSEAGAKREVSFNARELNALLAHNTNLAPVKNPLGLQYLTTKS